MEILNQEFTQEIIRLTWRNWFKPLPSNPKDLVPDAYIITNNTFASFSVIQACDAINL